MNTFLCKSELEQCCNLCDQKHIEKLKLKHIKKLWMATSMIEKQAKSVACLMLSEKLEQLKSGDYQLRQPVTLLANRIENDVKNGMIKIASPRSAIKSEEKILFGEEEPFRNEPAPGFGTAFFIGGEYVLTAGHCVCRAIHSSDTCLKTSDCESEYVKKMLLIFDFKMKNMNRCKDTFPASDVYKVEKVVCHKFIKIMDKNDNLYTKWVDWAIVKLTKKVEGRKPLAIDYFHGVAKNVHLYMLGHPSGLPVKLIKGGVVKKDDHQGYFECSLNAFSGNSGSPVFNVSTREVVGIFSGGGEDYEVTHNYKGTGRTRIQAHRVKKESEKCQRMSSLLVELDRCNILKPRSVSKVEQEDFIQSLKDSYTSQNEIPRLLHKTPVPIDIYVQLVLLQKEIKKPNGAIQEDEKEKYIRGMHRISWEEIQESKKAIDLDKLFDRLPDQTQAPKQLLIIGEAGVGKSTLCHHMTRQWAKGLLWKDKFDAVFWVQLHKLQDISPNETVSSFLFRSCCRKTRTLYPSEVMNYIKKNNERILFVFDGYDGVDLTNQAQKEIVDELRKNSYWILTSRPFAAQNIKADVTVENIGFTFESIKSYIRKLFLHDANRAEDTLQGIFQNPLIFDLCHVPINLEIVSTILEKYVDEQKNVFSIHSMSHLYQVLTQTFQRYFLERMGEKKCWEMEDSELEQELRLNKYSSVFEFLESAAWDGLKKKQFLLSFDKGDLQAFYCTHGLKTAEEQEKFCEKIYLSGFLRSYKRSSALYQSQHSFPHLTFQEFFSARYLVRLLQSEKRQSVNEAIQSLKDIKFNPRYKIVMWFMAGLLRDDAKNLNLFFGLLDDPKDVIGLYSTLLKVRCLEECEWTDKLNKIEEYEEEVRWWCSQVIHPTFWWSIDRFMSEVFEISPASTEKILSPILISLFKEKKMNYGYYTGQTGLLANPRGILPSIKGCLENSQMVESHLSELFGRIGQMDILCSLSLIKELLENKERVVRQNAINVLSQLGKTHLQLVLPLFVDALKDEYIRAQTVEAPAPLGKAEPTIIYPRLKKTLESEERMKLFASAIAASRLVDWSSDVEYIKYFIVDRADGDRNERFLPCTPLDSLIQNYGQQPINHSDYLLAIAVKCIEENTVIFLKDNHLCCYEKGEILPIEVPDAEARASKIQQTIKNLSKQIEEIKERK